MMPEWLPLALLAAGFIAGLVHIAYRSHRMAARAAVRAECLVCTYTETKQDVRAATTAGNMHGDKTGHPLILVKP